MKHPVIATMKSDGKIEEMQDFSPGWYHRATGISGHAHDDGTFTLPKPIAAPSWVALPTKKPLPVSPKPLPKSAAPATLGIYLTKWLEVSSGGRVYLNQRRGRFLNFKCNGCSDNWNVGEDLFVVNGQQAIPWELSEWVEKHHHVCKKWQGVGVNVASAANSQCTSCKWPYHKHAEAQPVFDAAKNEWVATKPPVGVAAAPVISVPGADHTGVKIAKSPTGRKFRE